MDQKKQDQQSEGFKGQQRPQHKPGEQKWQAPQTQNPNREPAEGPRHMPGSQEKGRDEDDEVTNRDHDRDMDEQDELSDRGTSRDQSER